MKRRDRAAINPPGGRVIRGNAANERQGHESTYFLVYVASVQFSIAFAVPTTANVKEYWQLGPSLRTLLGPIDVCQRRVGAGSDMPGANMQHPDLIQCAAAEVKAVAWVRTLYGKEERSLAKNAD